MSFLILLISIVSMTWARPSHYRELLDYVQPAPDQGETNTCRFVANTGAMELLANKFHGIKNPQPGGRFDLSESYVMWADHWENGTSAMDYPVHQFNRGYGIHIDAWPFEAWDEGYINNSVWNRHPNFYNLPHVSVPEIETIRLFQFGGLWSTYVLTEQNVEQVREALWTYKSPILINYNDDGYWHMILIVGYDDRIPGDCYDAAGPDCDSSKRGAFYIRDSFGVPVELRSYDWFRIKGNAAFVVKLKNEPDAP